MDTAHKWTAPIPGSLEHTHMLCTRKGQAQICVLLAIFTANDELANAMPAMEARQWSGNVRNIQEEEKQAAHTNASQQHFDERTTHNEIKEVDMYSSCIYKVFLRFSHVVLLRLGHGVLCTEALKIFILGFYSRDHQPRCFGPSCSRQSVPQKPGKMFFSKSFWNGGPGPLWHLKLWI